MNCFVKNLPQEMIPKELDTEFLQFGDIKSIRISTTFALKNGGENGQPIQLPNPPVSNRFGFVCFQSPEYADKAVDAGITNGIAIIKYQPRDPNKVRLGVNNIFVKNFDPNMTEEDLNTLFSKYGDITSMTLL